VTALAENKRAFFDYEILEKYEAGIELLGIEVKSVRAGRMNIQNAYATVRGVEVWLLNADIPAYQPKNAPAGYESTRSRRLLLHRSEIESLIGKIKEKNLTLLPLRVYIKGRRLKIELGLGRHKKKVDKRETIKKREVSKDIARVLKRG
jgi:SsrA-binding protein